MEPIKIYKREAFFIRKKDLKPSTLEKLELHNRHLFFEEKACANCEWHEERLADASGLSEKCEDCPAYKGGVNLCKAVTFKKVPYISLPFGDRKNMERIIGKEVVYKSKHNVEAFSRKMKFTGELRGHQREAVDCIKKTKQGIIKAPPRSGKTVLSTAAVCEIGKKTLILASQREWLDGFHETFCGSSTQKPLTNAKKSQVGFAKTLADFKKYDVCLTTVQTFNSEKGQKLLAKIRDMFTVLVVDEVRLGAANKFAIAISRLNVKYKIGLDGTPNRKDGRFVIIDALIGKVIYEAKVKRLRPTVRLVRTQYRRVIGRAQPQWVSLVSHLEKDPARLKLIAKWAIKDAKDGHMVLIPFARVTVIKALCKAINIMSGKKMAKPFFGGLKKDVRKQLIQDARNYKVRIIVGNIKLLSTGLNIPRASALYEVTMSSNKENAEQRVSRILTPWDDKPPPLLRIFLDDLSIRKRCLANEWWSTISPKFRPIITDKDLIILKGYLAEKQKAEHASWEL
jgi:superfamily II DNA or RNA helicase